MAVVKILVADDEEDIGKTLLRALADFSSRETVQWVWARDGRSAVQLFQQHKPFDVAILDIHLPDMSGTDVASLIRRNQPDQQILYCTGDLSKETLTYLLGTGLANGFVPKGGALETLREPVLRAIHEYRKKLSLIGQHPKEPRAIELKLQSLGMAGQSEALHTAIRDAERFSTLPASVLILARPAPAKRELPSSF